MIRPYLIAGVAVALAGAVTVAVWQYSEARSLRDANAALRASLAAAEEARDFNRILADQANANRLAAERRDAVARRALETLLTGDFADADTPLDPRLSDYLACLRTGAADCVPAPGRSGRPVDPVPGE